jgi:hypothetical protein
MNRDVAEKTSVLKRTFLGPGMQVEVLPSKCEALSSSPEEQKKKKKVHNWYPPLTCNATFMRT